MKVVRLSASRTSRLYSQEMFLVLIFTRAKSTPGPWYGRKKYVTEKSSDTTGNRSRNLPTNYATPGPHIFIYIYIYIYLYIYMCVGGRYIDKLKPLSTPFKRSRCIQEFLLLIILGTRWSFIINSRPGHCTCGYGPR